MRSIQYKFKNNYKRIIMKYKTITLGVIAFSFFAVSAYANKDFNVDDKVQKLKTELVLTDDQVRAIKPILEDYKNKLDQAGDEKEQRLGEVLTPDQMARLKDAKKNMKDKY